MGPLPWLAYEHQASTLADLEAEGPTTMAAATEAYAAQEQARADWTGWGAPLVVGGTVVLAAGVAAAAAGLVWGLLRDDAGAAE